MGLPIKKTVTIEVAEDNLQSEKQEQSRSYSQKMIHEQLSSHPDKEKKEKKTISSESKVEDSSKPVKQDSNKVIEKVEDTRKDFSSKI